MAIHTAISIGFTPRIGGSVIVQVEFDINNPRVRKARLGARLSKPMRLAFLKFTVALLLVGMIFVVITGHKFGYLLGIPAIPLLMVWVWYKGELQALPPTFQPNATVIKLHEALDARVIGRLKTSQPSPYDIWKAVNGMWRQQFFSVRFGIGTDIFEQSLSRDPTHTPVIIEQAVHFAEIEQQAGISGSALTVALLFSIQGYESYLQQLQLEPDDIVAGLRWQQRIVAILGYLAERHSAGGIARDWTAGYTPLLNQVGHNVSQEVQLNKGLLLHDTESHQQTIQQLVGFLKQGSRNNVVLVGDVGVGKTTAVKAFARNLLFDRDVPEEIRYAQVFSLDAAVILANTKGRAALEDIVLRILNETYHAKNIILFLDDAQLFLEEGTGSADLSNLLLPVMQAGNLRIVLSMTPQQWQHLSAHNSALAGLLNAVMVQPPTQENIMNIMEDQVLLVEYHHKVTFMYQAIQEAYRLADRYMSDTAFPGKGIRLLETAVNNAAGSLVTAESVQKSIESSLGVKVSKATHTEKQQLLHLEDELHQRMINQSRAVQVVSDALRRSRSGVGNPNRPVGTFLFLGPTGVGKTELTKALADAYFGGKEHMVRVDMNEYVQSSDVERLLASSAAENTNSFLSQMKRDPFSVVLFDEIEKAHPDIVNTLLQLIDEGRIRDSDNREVSFRDAIIIATSNAGANEIRQRIEAGQNLETFEQEFIDQLVATNQFKPEFLNRFDEIVLFRPLNKPELLQVVELLIQEVNVTLNRQKVRVELTDAAKQWIVDNGYDARLGARPMRRMVQRSVENIVAKRLLQTDSAAGNVFTLDVAELAAEHSTSS